MSLMFVMGGGVILTTLLFNIAIHVLKNPLFSKDKLSNYHGTVTPGLIIGAAIFGVGWGLAGICPGPGFVNMFHDP